MALDVYEWSNFGLFWSALVYNTIRPTLLYINTQHHGQLMASAAFWGSIVLIVQHLEPCHLPMVPCHFVS